MIVKLIEVIIRIRAYKIANLIEQVGKIPHSQREPNTTCTNEGGGREVERTDG